MAGLGEIINQALRGQGQPVAGVISKILGLVVMGIAGVLLAKLWGGMGIACGYLVGELVAFGGLMIVAIRYYSDSEWLTLCPTMADASFLWSKILRREEASKI
jgi:Na+-driven multidrug efflux pump